MTYQSRTPDLFEPLRREPVLCFPPFQEIAGSSLLNIPLSSNTTDFTHGLHRFPAKFVPQIPAWAIHEFSQPGGVVLDPFAGSGTTLVEAIAAGRNGIGIDLDPLNAFLCRAKTVSCSPANLEILSREVLNYVPVPECLTARMAGVRNFHHWFRPEIAAALEGLYLKIQGLKCSESERVFYFAIFSSILRWVSNADDQTQKTYVSGTSPKNIPDLNVVLKRQIERGIKGSRSLAAVERPGSASVLLGTAENLPISTDAVDLIVTSPPYLDSVDYMYNFMLEYFWLGPRLGVQSRDDFNALKNNRIGSKAPASQFAIPFCIDDLIEADRVPRYRRKSLGAYFHLMQKHFEEAARVLKPQGTYVLIVGNSKTEQGVLPVHDCLARLAASAGLVLQKAFGYRLRRHYMKFPRKGRGGIILMDWVIVLRPGKSSAEPPRLSQPDLHMLPDAVAN